MLDDRLLLHLPDPVDLTLAGLDVSVGRARRPPGRAIDLRTGLDVQLALPGSVPSADSTTTAIDEVVRLASDTTGARPWKVKPLPDSVAQTDLRVSTELVTVGLGGDDARAVGFRPHAGQRRILVAGAPRMGTSNALAVIGTQLVAAGRAVAVVARHHARMHTWASENGCHAVLPEDAVTLVELRSTIPDLCLVVDEADRLDGTPVEPVLLDHARNLAGTAGILVAGADLSRALAAFRGLVPEVARDANGLIIGAVAPTDGDLFRIRLDASGHRRRGRGFLVTDGDAVPVQVALAGRPP
ncbi:hypothetical protein ACWEOW_13435 [Monashia sp. NPDC004114]